MKPALRHLLECVTGTPSAEAQAWAAEALAKVWRDGDALGVWRCIGVGTRQKALDAIRNDLMRQAAEHLDGGITQRAEQLARLCRDMEGRLWPLWCDEAEAPARAGPALGLLFRAKHLGATLPAGVRTVFDILTADAAIDPNNRTKWQVR
ncbi:MAG: hypothetical protein AB1482_03855 [Pseudomonadota bacterium]